MDEDSRVNLLRDASGVILVQRQVLSSQAEPSEQFQQYATKVLLAQVLKFLLFWQLIDPVLQSAAQLPWHQLSQCSQSY